MYYAALAGIILIFLWRMAAGFRKGMVQEIISLIAMAAAGVCVFLIIGAVGSFMDQEIGSLIQIVAVLIAVCLAYRLVNLLFVSLKLISKLPIVKGLDKVLGAVVGFAEAGILVRFLVQIIKNWGIMHL
ncbi:MAG: CvpA family protein [Lachnospiraceae bacterium]|jgi:membrane protein required for colicin V production|nr:CvpA family protein [Lachnospiraceae bacterium]